MFLVSRFCCGYTIIPFSGQWSLVKIKNRKVSTNGRNLRIHRIHRSRQSPYSQYLQKAKRGSRRWQPKPNFTHTWSILSNEQSSPLWVLRDVILCFIGSLLGLYKHCRGARHIRLICSNCMLLIGSCRYRIRTASNRSKYCSFAVECRQWCRFRESEAWVVSSSNPHCFII